jgi:hypothetical protein
MAHRVSWGAMQNTSPWVTKCNALNVTRRRTARRQACAWRSCASDSRVRLRRCSKRLVMPNPSRSTIGHTNCGLSHGVNHDVHVPAEAHVGAYHPPPGRPYLDADEPRCAYICIQRYPDPDRPLNSGSNSERCVHVYRMQYLMEYRDAGGGQYHDASLTQCLGRVCCSHRGTYVFHDRGADGAP